MGKLWSPDAPDAGRPLVTRRTFLGALAGSVLAARAAAAAPIIPPWPGPPLVVGTTPDPGFMALESFANHLVAGTYGTPRSYALTPAGAFIELPAGDLAGVGESLFDMASFSRDGQCYAVTESTGQILRLEDDGWHTVFRAPAGVGWNNGYSITERRGVLITGFNRFPANDRTLLCVSGDGTNWGTIEWPGHHHPRFGVLDGLIHASWARVDGGVELWREPGVQLTGSLGGFPGQMATWRDALWFGVQLHADGVEPGVAVYRWDGAITTVLLIGDQALVTGALATPDALYIATGTGWRAPSGVSRVYGTRDGLNWVLVATLPEPEAWGLAWHRGDPYVSTRREGGGGKVYRLPAWASA
jgi:hypothetical protein